MWLWWVTACVPKLPPAPLSGAGAAPDPGPAPVGGPWETVVGADSPLVGRLWNVAERRWGTEAELLADLRGVEVVLLGEKHDNPDHHRLQARVVEALHPASCVFEMLDDGDPIETAADSNQIAALSQWDTSGWPSFSLYAPVFDACYAAGARIAAGHPVGRQINAVMSGGSLSAQETEGLPPLALAPDARDHLAETIVGAHCGQLPIEHTGTMVEAQMLKDAWMTRAVERSPVPTVLIAGAGHTNGQYGVPTYLIRSHRSVAFAEADGRPPEEYATASDWVWFTPAVDDLDPCAAFGNSAG